MIIKFKTQSAVMLLMEQSLVRIYASVTTQTQTNFHPATLVTHINLLQDINVALQKPKRCWRAATTSHQVRLRCFAFKKGKFKQPGSQVFVVMERKLESLGTSLKF